MHPKRVDANQAEITKAFRVLGASVLILSSVGKGCPDIAVGYAGKTYLFEIKNGDAPKSQQKLTPAEDLFFNEWNGHVKIISTLEEVKEFMKDLKWQEILEE